ncbi:MAG: hypothetical protein D6713_05475 [Deltaproteobacteria bacterium]|nr:MAG: hypothetical protein D6713_05475 [Deltaproteobacteria bacterium]
MRKKTLLIILPLLFAAILAADLVYLSSLISRRMEEGLLQIPSRVLGREIVVAPGTNVYSSFLFANLERAGYRETTRPRLPGHFAIEGEKITVIPRPDGTGPGAAVIELDDDGDVERIYRGREELPRLSLGRPEIGRLTDPRRQVRAYSPIDEISPHLVKAVIAAEDRRFYQHHGIDPRAIARALVKDVASMSFREGGSTITQQLARNFFLSFRKSLLRKFQEALIALLLEARFSKNKILELYLNQVYLGQRGSEGIYGVEEASRYYFGKSANALTLSEAILIASLIKSPNYYSPFTHPDRTLQRMRYVARAMEEEGYISRREAEEALRKFPTLNMRTERATRLDYVTDAIVMALEEKLEDRDILYGGYEIRTSLDPVLVDLLKETVPRTLSRIEKRYGLEKPLQAAVVMVDNETGETVAFWGGRSYRESQFNRAVAARRQVGSLFKPFVALAALKESKPGFETTLASVIPAKDVSWDTPDGKWVPRNFNGKVWEKATVREILEHSINTGIVALGKRTGLDKVITLCRSLGIGENLKPYPSLLIGSFTYTPLSMAYAYSTIASLGLKHRPRIVESVIRDGVEVVSFPDFPVRVLKPEVAYLVLYALQGAVREGTAKRLGKAFPENVAGKTGTTDDGRDSWFVAMTRDYTICAWVGYDDASPTPLTGATGALPLCEEVLKKVYRAKPPAPFPVPPGIVFRDVDEETGLLATSGCERVVREAFVAGTEPTAFCSLHPPSPLEETGRKLLDFLRDVF